MGALPYFLRNSIDDQQEQPAGMAAPVQMAPPSPVVQHPLHAIIAPISAPPPDPMQMMAAQKPNVQLDPNPMHQQEGKEQHQLMADYAKDADPWGSPDNHPGILGKIGHGLSQFVQNAQHEQGKMTPREADESKLQKDIQGIEAEKSKEGLEGAQAGNIGAEEKKTETETPLIAPKAQADLEHETAETNALKNPQPKDDFALWHQQNPNGTAEEYQRMRAQPITQEDADSRNAVWDSIADKYHLPKGQFKPGMSAADASALAAAMNNVIGRNQGAQSITIKQEAANTAASKATDAGAEKEYTYTRNKWDKYLGTYAAQNEKLNEATGFIGRGALGDALGAIKSLSGLASGQGSGVRITQAELNSIAHARGLGGDFQAAMQKFGDGRSLTPQQETQLKGILSSVQAVASAKEKVLNQGLDDLANATDTKTIRKIDSQLRHVLMGGQ